MAGKLLDLVLDAHGGMNRWSELSDLIVDTTLGGSLWAQVGVPTILPNVRLSLSLKRQHVMMHSDTAKERMLFDSFGMSLFAPEQRPLRLEDPRQSIMERPGYPWTELQAGYFIGYAMWQYLTAPFLYSYPGFQTEEVEAWHEGGETGSEEMFFESLFRITSKPTRTFNTPTTGLMVSCGVTATQ